MPGPNPKAALQGAIALALAGDWQAAHVVAQEHEGDAVANWLHAVVHRMEGDLGNARYWYGRCGRVLRPGVSAADELREIEAVLRS
jgi:hypothetical protein